MKSYNNLFEKLIDRENIRAAFHGAAHKKTRRKDVARVLENIDHHIDHLIDILQKGEFKPVKGETKTVNEHTGKKVRQIQRPNYRYEQVVHHAIVQVLKPIFMKGMYHYCCGSIPKRGVHYGKRYIESIKGSRDMKYCAVMDMRKFYESIDHEVLRSLLERKIRDKQMLELIGVVIHSCDKGLPLGFYASQWFANFLLQGLDHFIKEDLRVKHYIRYLDDMVMFGRNKKELHKAVKEVTRYANEKLNLKIKKNWQVFRFDYVKDGVHHGRPLDFMGFVFYSDRTIIRKSIMIKAARKARKTHKKHKTTWRDALSILSYMGWFSHTDSYNAYLKHIKPYVNIRDLKRCMSRHQRKVNKDGYNMGRHRGNSGRKTVSA